MNDDEKRRVSNKSAVETGWMTEVSRSHIFVQMLHENQTVKTNYRQLK